MKKLCFLALAAICLPSCWIAQIVTEVPTTEPVVPVQTVYTTQVTTPSPKVTTVTTFVVTNYSTDPCFYLDLNAVAAAFADSRSVREFEQILNSSRYMINNLDLNRDGWIDYLRVIETHRGYYHTFLIQACLAPGMFQDVATLVAERQANALFVEVIGDPYLYGYNYIVRPVFVKRPPLWDSFGHSGYAVWSSPYYYGYYPSYYTKPKPVYLNHYQAYVSTYMTNCPYCHHCDYPQQPHYSGYTEMTQSHRRNDYAVAHPDNSFSSRVTRVASSSGVSVRNAAQLRTEVEKSTRSTGTSSSTNASSTTRTSSTSSSTRTTSTTGTTTTTRTTTPTTTTRQPSTSVDTRVNKSGTTRTTVKTTDATGRTQTVKRESTTSTRSSSTSGTRATGTSTRSSQDTKTESNPRSGQRVR